MLTNILVLVCMLVSLSSACVVGTRCEAEDPTNRLVGLKLVTRVGASAGKMVEGWDANNDSLIMIVKVTTAGAYDLKIGYRSSYGDKYGKLTVNGVTYDLRYPLQAAYRGMTVHFGNIVLKSGENKVVLHQGDWYQIDFIEVNAPVSFTGLQTSLIDSKANARTTSVFQYFTSQWGKKIVSGQFTFGDADSIRKITGKSPAVIGNDFGFYEKKHLGINTDLDASGYLNTMSWHWMSPTGAIDAQGYYAPCASVNGGYGGASASFYTCATNFDLQKALDNPTGTDYKKMIQNMDTIASWLKILQSKNIPIVWRPLHEADGEWFWWGAKGPDAFKKLWSILYHRFTDTHKLHNLIWVYSMSDRMKADWYPGDSLVDVVGVDLYHKGNSPCIQEWTMLRDRYPNKMIALTEYGLTPNLKEMDASQVRWSFIMPWNGDFSPIKDTKETLINAYATTNLITKSQLPASVLPLSSSSVKPSSSSVVKVSSSSVKPSSSSVLLRSSSSALTPVRNLYVAPNPIVSRGDAFFELNLTPNMRILQFEVYDMSGIMVRKFDEQNLHSGSFVVWIKDSHQLQVGKYVLRVMSNGTLLASSTFSKQ